MRQLGKLPGPREAQQLADYLLTLGIETRVDAATADGTVLWVYDENRVGQARQALEDFARNPADARFVTAQSEAARLRDEQEAARRKTRTNVVELRDRWHAPASTRAPLTMLLLGASVAVSLWTEFGHRPALLQWLWLSTDSRSWLPEVLHGEVWRLWTPMFVHYGWMHLVFNMYWLYVLGSVIEIRRGTLELFLLVLVSQLGCSLGEALVGEMQYGGMSGVGYALLGYCWIKSRFEPRAGIYVDPQTIFLMVGWALLCLAGVMGDVANAAHFVGLGLGMAFAYLPLLVRPAR